MERLRSLHAARMTPEEAELLAAAVSAAGGTPGSTAAAVALPLDRATRFLVELSAIPSFELRAECWLARVAFPETIFEIQTQLDALDAAVLALNSAERLSRVLAHVLAFGNYLNGGTARGQADGFHLEILPKLRDVKATDNSTHLLAVLVDTCFQDPALAMTTVPSAQKSDDDATPAAANTLAVARGCPVPAHTLLAPAVEVSFDDINARLRKAEADIGVVSFTPVCQCENSHILFHNSGVRKTHGSSAVSG